MAPSDEKPVVCPSCVEDLATSGALFSAHRCDPEAVRVQVDQASARLVACPQCANQLDVSCFDPLEIVTCGYCSLRFGLLEEFAGYRLLKVCDLGWPNAVYTARHLQTNRSALVKVLSSHVLGQPNAKRDFLEQVDKILVQCSDAIVVRHGMGCHAGFHYLAMEMLSEGMEGELLRATGMCPVGIEAEPSGLILHERAVACPRCSCQVDATFNDPLDRLSCANCQVAFELLREFGTFHIKSRLNIGGSSIIYLAEHPPSKKDVALKILRAVELHRNPESVQRFLTETELTGRLEHPNVIQMYEGGEYCGFHYMALELVEGLTLDEIMDVVQRHSKHEPAGRSWTWVDKERYRPGIPELICLEIAIQAAAGLGVAHHKGLIHGDVKPENIMVTRSGIVKVLDFGLVQFASAEKLIREGDSHPIYGTPLYIPPERVYGEREDFRSDIYSLGATLYHLLRGIPPFTAKSPSEIAIKHAKSPLISFKAYAPWISEPTCRVVEKSLKKSSHERYSSHIEFIADLTLAKNQILNRLEPEARLDGVGILRSFMSSLPLETEFGIPGEQGSAKEISAYRSFSETFVRYRNRILGRNPDQDSSHPG
jgi:serine/threonine protein kinase